MSKASDFFGMDFSAKPEDTVAQPIKEETPTGVVSKAMSFFGIDFGGPRQKVEAPVAQPAIAIRKPSGGVDVSTEANMKKASFITPTEKQPDTQSDASNLAEIDGEIKRATDPKVIAILKEERKKYAPATAAPDYGNRPDGSKKGTGYFGELKVPGTNDVATEYSIGINIDGKDMDVPTLVPTLTPEEKTKLLKIIATHGPIPESIIRKAAEHAKQRIKEGKSPFAN